MMEMSVLDRWWRRIAVVGCLAGCLGLGWSGPAAAVELAAGPVKHVVKAGETVNLLALRYKVPAEAILKANPGLSPNRLQLGQEILIPGSGRISVADKTPVPLKAVPSAKPTPLGKPALPGVETLPAGPPESVELRPEKAPQATPPLRERDLAEPARRPEPAKPAPAASAAMVAEPAPSPTPAPEPTAAPTPATEPRPAAPVPATPQAAPSRPVTATPGFLPLLGLAAVVFLGLGWLSRGVCDNVLSGLALRLARRPRVGDRVRLDGVLGRVEALGWRTTTVRTEAGERLLVPNARVGREAIVVQAANGS